jgi:ABC-type Fe3+-citrate transport system substrate-binding protein
LPSILTKIEADNNHDQLTPIFAQHKKHLNDFGCPINDRTQEQLQRVVFQQSRSLYNREENRKIYMGSILNNLGLGSGLNSRTSE